MAEIRMFQLRGEQQPPNHKALWILWGAFVGALCLYALVGYTVRQSLSSQPDQETLSWLVPIFGGVGAMLTLLIFAWGHRLAKGTDYQAYSIIRWALAEAIGIFGLVLYLLGASETTAGAFLGWALLSEFRLMPTPEDYQRFLGQKG